MIKTLFKIYRHAPFWMRELFSKSLWLFRLIMPNRSIEVDGYTMKLDLSDNGSFKYLADRGAYEKMQRSAFLAIVIQHPRSCVIDLGAHYGSYTLDSAKLHKLGLVKRVISVEPDPRPFYALKESIAENGFGAIVDQYQYIISDNQSEETLFLNARSSADNRTHQVTSAPIRCKEKISVRSITVDQLLVEASEPLDGYFVIKMDLQGNEIRAFRGMRVLLQQAAGYSILFEYGPYLLDSAGTPSSELLDIIKELQADGFYRIFDDRYENLKGFQGLSDSFSGVSDERETKIQGAVTDFLIQKNMKSPFIENGEQKPHTHLALVSNSS